jgi:asparagine synthase (glutamine-hydrolysing)
MGRTLQHRGPDDSGVWSDAEAGVGLAHRRLSIVDLSAAGHQPMSSPDRRFTLSYNGEIYNFAALRQELEARGHGFQGHSDTEVMLAAFAEWGVEAAVKRFVGMFAFAVWDARERVLHLCRDRVGEKPLYYGWAGKAFVFGSELKALRAHPAWRGEIDRDALALLLRYNYIPAPYSIYKGVFKLLPGTILTVSADALERRELPAPHAYWSAREVAEAGMRDPFAGDADEATAVLEQLLREAIAGQMVADVPLGAFLSGGIDSSLVVALMQAQSGRPVKTFTIGFHEAAYNEAEFAKAVAGHLGTEHTELYVTPKEALAVIPRLPALYDEPFADSSQIPTFLVSQLTRRSVTVSLSGDGGDELFGGYNRYFWGRRIWDKIGWMPRGLRRSAARGIVSVSPAAWDATFHGLGPLLPGKFKQTIPGDRMHKLAEVLGVEHPEAMYRSLVSMWKTPTELVPGASEPPTELSSENEWPALPDFVERMMYLDLMTYLPDDILVKVDRAAMGVSLETRVPYLDHRVVEFAWRLPLALKIRGGKGKWLLRQILYKYVPPELIERPKTGFGIPIDSWLRGPLRAWAEELLDEGRLKREGFFDPRPIRQKWAEHLSGNRNWQYYLWGVLMFQAWLEETEAQAVAKVA